MKHLFIAALLLPSVTIPSFAHSGGLNAQGCHNNLKTGDYHCHRSASPPVTDYVPFSEAQGNMFGAIAYSEQTGTYGYSDNHQSRAAAENRALKECSSRSEGCKVAIWFRNACGALARGNSGWATAWARTNILAGQQAVRNCSQYSKNCSVTRWVCTSR